MVHILKTITRRVRAQLFKEDKTVDITNKMLMELADEIGMKTGKQISDQNIEDMQKIAETMKDKGDEELLAEIAKVKEAIKKDRKAYEQQIKTVKALRPMMNREQRARLDRIIAMLEV